jgi:hypothetical protein
VGFSDFCYEFKIWNCIFGVFKYFYITYSLKSFEGSCFELKKSIFEMKHTCSF